MVESTVLLKCLDCRQRKDKVSRTIFKARNRNRDRCHFCGKTYVKEDNQKTKNKADKNVVYVKCKICALVLQKNSLTRHLAIHDKTIQKKCFMCHKILCDLWHLREHIIAVHGKIKRFSCHLCDQKFTRKNSKVKHVRQIHERPLMPRSYVTCPRCHIPLGKNSLKRHIQNVHENQRTFRCNKCPRTFKSETNLRDHNRLDHSEPKFRCNPCNRSTAYRQCWNRHLRSARHLRIIENPEPGWSCDLLQGPHDHPEPGWSCGPCRRSTVHLNSWKRHLKSKFHLNKIKRLADSSTPSWTCGPCGRTTVYIRSWERHLRTPMHLNNEKLANP